MKGEAAQHWPALVMVQVQEDPDPAGKMMHPYKVVTNYESMFSDLPQYPSHSYVPVNR